MDNITHFFKDLLIDAFQEFLSNVDTTNKLFLIKLGPLQNVESSNTINTLADNAFKHQIIYRYYRSSY